MRIGTSSNCTDSKALPGEIFHKLLDIAALRFLHSRWKHPTTSLTCAPGCCGSLRERRCSDEGRVPARNLSPPPSRITRRYGFPALRVGLACGRRRSATTSPCLLEAGDVASTTGGIGKWNASRGRTSIP